MAIQISYGLLFIWVESTNLDDQKTYDDLPLTEKISLSFVSQGMSFSYQWPGNYSWNCIYMCRLSTKHSMDGNMKAF